MMVTKQISHEVIKDRYQVFELPITNSFVRMTFWYMRIIRTRIIYA
jgi:hypothetical protein